MRKTLLFGNGLGMALDQNHFYLPNALQRIWDSNALNPVHKQLISACLPHQLGNCPQGEDELDKLHVAISSCEYLSEIRRIDDLHWLSPYGWDFPSVCRSFITQVATHLYDFVNPLPEEFGAKLPYRADPHSTQTNSYFFVRNFEFILATSLFFTIRIL
jgi:hypothetical protein